MKYFGLTSYLENSLPAFQLDFLLNKGAIMSHYKNFW